MQDKFVNILKSDECISEEMMLKYLGDALSPADRHRIERHLIECDFCSDAMEGLTSQNLSDTKDSLKQLDKRIEQRVSNQTGNSFQRHWVYRIAAVVVLVSLFGGGYYYLQSIKKSERVFTENFEPFHETTLNASPAAVAPPAETEELKLKDASSQLDKKEEQRKQVGNAVVVNENTKATKSAVKEANKNDVLVDAKTTTGTEFSLDNKDLATPTSIAEDQNTILLSDESKREDKFSVKQPPAMKEMRENTTRTAASNNEAVISKKSLADSGSIVVVTGTAASITSNNLVPDGIKQYEAKNYSDAISLFNAALSNDRSNTEALFYNGVSHLSNNENKDAIHLLESVVNNSPNKFSDAAKWYLSLAYLKERKIVRAKNILEDLSGSKNEYQSKAKKALEELK